MKKTLKLLALAAAFLTVTFTGCFNGLSDATVTGPGVGGKKVTLYANSDSDIIIFGNGTDDARTIMPGTIDGTDTSKYKFWLWGEDKLGVLSTSAQAALRKPTEVTFKQEGTSTTKGSVNLDLEVSQYELYLVVTPSSVTTLASSDAAKAAAILYASAVVDFRSSDSVNFFLSPYKLSAGGGIALTVYADGSWTVPSTHTVTIGVYNLNSAGAAADAVTGIDENAAFTLPGTAPGSANFSSTSTTAVSPGTYNFIVKLVPDPASGLTKTYYYSDKIVVLSNQITTQTIAIPNIITTKPADPEAFGVSYLDPLSNDSDYYEVQFVWTDKSYNEDYFELELLDFTGLSDSLTSASSTHISALAAATGASGSSFNDAWEKDAGAGSHTGLRADANLSGEVLYTFGKKISKKVSNNPPVTGDYFYNNPEFWVDGSFNKNSTYAVLRLPLGHRYFARLCAVNDVGKSEYLYADIIGTTVTSSVNYNRYGNTVVSSTKLSKFGDSTEINRFRITYNLNDGVFYEADSSDYKALVSPNVELPGIAGLNASKNAVIQYGTQKPKAETTVSTILNPLHAPDTAGTKYGMLHDGDMNRWTNWLKDNANGTILDISGDVEAAGGNPAVPGYKTNSEKSPAVWTENAYEGYSNLDLYASYRISRASTKIDESSNYNITSNMVKVFYNTANSFPASPTAATPKEGVYKFVNATALDANAPTGSVAAQYLYIALVNDATNNVVGGTPVSYDKVVMKVLRNGNTSKQTTTASTTPSTITFTNAAGSSATASASYVQIPIKAYAAGKYAVQIHAYANTQQGEYTYTLYFEVTDPSGVAAAPAPTFTPETKTFAFADITAAGALTGTSIASASSGTPANLTASDNGSGTVTVTSVAAGDSVVTLTDNLGNTQTFTFTVSSTGAISVTGITLH